MNNIWSCLTKAGAAEAMSPSKKVKTGEPVTSADIPLCAGAYTQREQLLQQKARNIFVCQGGMYYRNKKL
jgi:hypothetical protein